MKQLLFGYLLCACAALVAAEKASANNVSTNKAPAGVRNPFWPMGYEGEREVISPKARPKPKSKQDPAKTRSQRPALSSAERARLAAEKAAAEKAAKEAAEKAAKEAAERAAREAAERAEAERKKREITDVHWVAARKSLSFGSRMTFREEGRERMSIVINGKDYVDGDSVTIIHNSRRFTWRFVGLPELNKVKLEPVSSEYIEQPKDANNNLTKE